MRRFLLTLAFLGACTIGLGACAQCTEKCENQCAAADCSCESVENGECICASCGEEIAAVPNTSS